MFYLAHLLYLIHPDLAHLYLAYLAGFSRSYASCYFLFNLSLIYTPADPVNPVTFIQAR